MPYFSFLSILYDQITFLKLLKTFSRLKLLTCLSVSRYWTEDKRSPLISGQPLCKSGDRTFKLLMQKQHNSTKTQHQHLEGKNLKPQLPHQQPSQHDIFPPTSMCGEKRQGGRGRGEETSKHGRSLSLKKKVKKSKCSLVKKPAISENTAKKKA